MFLLRLVFRISRDLKQNGSPLTAANKPFFIVLLVYKSIISINVHNIA